MRIEESVMVPIGDDVNLATDLFFPDDEDSGPWPVILVRTPYDKNMSRMAMGIEQITSDGYVIAIQDVRGRYASEGNFEPLLDEGPDGVEMIAWVRDQAWCNGNVGTTSGSYVGATQWLPALEQPEGLLTATPQITGSLFNGFGFYTRGVPQLDILFLWMASLADDVNSRRDISYSTDHPQLKAMRDVGAQVLPLMRQAMTMDPSGPEAAEIGQQLASLQQELTRLSLEFLSLPLAKMASDLSNYAPWLENWLENIDDPDASYWKAIDWAPRRDDVAIPMLHLAGWHDLFIRGTLKDFAALSSRENGPFQKIVIAPDAHATQFMEVPMGEVLFPAEFAPDAYMMLKTPAKEGGQLYKRWMDHWLKGEDSGLLQEAPITLYVQGENVWRDEWEWPLARTNWTPVYLASNGRLSFDVPDGEEAPDSYAYDPANPVPSKGGTFLNLGFAPGVFEQSEIEQRDDVLVYTSEVLEKPLEVTGPVSMKLWASTSAVDSDFTAKLVDVRPDGQAYNICDGVTRLRFRKEVPGLVTPGEVQEVEIELSSTSYLFDVGHQIRLQVSSSNFPMIDPNPNTGRSLITDETNEMIVAEQTVYHDTARPSHLVLPIIPRR